MTERIDGLRNESSKIKRTSLLIFNHANTYIKFFYITNTRKSFMISVIYSLIYNKNTNYTYIKKYIK